MDLPIGKVKTGITETKGTKIVSPYSNNAYNHVAPLGTIKVSIKGGAFHCHSKN